MFTFLRKIRKSLSGTGDVRRYLFYAIGEIALVVIGILIALQVNNWNEWQKEKDIEKAYLLRIKDDLEVDQVNLESIISGLETRLKSYSLVDSTFYLPPEMQDSSIDTNFRFNQLTHEGKQFRPTIGAYRALISDGRSNIISNRDLFSQIQHIYEIFYDVAKENSIRIDGKSDQIRWARRHEVRNNISYTKILDSPSSLLDELHYFYDHQKRYFELLTAISRQLSVVTELIGQELSLKK